MTSKFSIDNKELLQRISSGEAVVGIDFGNLIVRELAAFRLAAMDSEPVEMPLDYLQGHKDGLEWASQLAEANHPETGDWLYDDPIELAKAIRKGPDMPPAQPVADSEPVAYMTYKGYLLHAGDPKLAEYSEPMPLYADPRPEPISAEPVAWLLSGGGAKNVVVFDSGNAYADPLREVTPLYRHAQPAPVSYSDFEEFWSAYIHPLAQDDELKGFAWDIWSVLGSNSQPAPVVPDEKDKTVDADDHPLLWSFNEGWNACRAAMLAVAPQPQNAPQNIPEIIPGGLVEAVNNLLNNDGSRGCYDAMECNAARVEIELWLAQRQRQREQRKTNLSAGISPVIPEGWQVEAEKLAEIYGMSFVLFRHGEVPQCADPTKVVISFTDKGLGHDTLPAAHQEVKP